MQINTPKTEKGQFMLMHRWRLLHLQKLDIQAILDQQFGRKETPDWWIILCVFPKNIASLC